MKTEWQSVFIEALGERKSGEIQGESVSKESVRWAVNASQPAIYIYLLGIS